MAPEGCIDVVDSHGLITFHAVVKHGDRSLKLGLGRFYVCSTVSTAMGVDRVALFAIFRHSFLGSSTLVCLHHEVSIG